MSWYVKEYILYISWDFCGGPVVKISPSNAGRASMIFVWRAKIPHALQPKKNIQKENIKQKQSYNKFNKDFINDPHQKNNALF